MCKISDIFVRSAFDKRYFVAQKPFRMCGKIFPENAVYTQFDGVRYVCDSFPAYDYKGKNIRLFVWSYNTVYAEWERDIIAVYSMNDFERKLAWGLWNTHKKYTKKTVHPARKQKVENYDSMMKSAVTKKKSGGSGSRLIPGIEARDFGPSEPNWKEHSTYAHWAFSGDASMVAMAARYDL